MSAYYVSDYYLSKVGIGVGYLVRQTAAMSFYNLLSTDLNLKSPGKSERKSGNQMDKTKAVLGRKTIYNWHAKSQPCYK